MWAALGPPPLFSLPTASPSPPWQPLGMTGQRETPSGSSGLRGSSPPRSSRYQADANPHSDRRTTCQPQQALFLYLPLPVPVPLKPNSAPAPPTSQPGCHLPGGPGLHWLHGGVQSARRDQGIAPVPSCGRRNFRSQSPGVGRGWAGLGPGRSHRHTWAHVVGQVRS